MYSTNTPKLVTHKSPWRWLWRTLATLICAGLIWLGLFEKTVEIPEAEAQTLLDAQLVKIQEENPDLRINHARLDFGENIMSLDFSGGRTFITEQFGEILVSTDLSTVGDPDFAGGSVYFRANEFEFDELLFNGEDPLTLMLRLITETAVEAPGVRDRLLGSDRAQGVLNTLRDRVGVNIDVDEQVNNAAIAAAEATASRLVEEYREPAEQFLEGMVVAALERTPLYTLNHSWMERAAAAAISDIGIIDGQLTVTISGLKLLWTLFAIVLAVSYGVLMFFAALRGGGGGLFLGAIAGSI